MIRLMLGYANVSWQSIIVPPMPPRATLDPIVGGYRRIPVAQIGADLYCDTRLICEEIASLTEIGELSYRLASPESAEFATKVNDQIFFPVVQTAVAKSALKMLITRYWPWQIAALLQDRAKVAKQMKGPRISHAERHQTLNEFKQDLDAKLIADDFLFGNRPSIADFAAYHLVWFADLTRPGRFLDGFQSASDWQQRMAEFGHGQSETLSKKTLFQMTKESTPKALSEDQTRHMDIGKTVTIQPHDYADDGTQGQLLGADEQRWTIARESAKFGVVHVHFPRHGYLLSAID